MRLLDSSVLIAYLRDGPGAAAGVVEGLLLDPNADARLCDPVVMELLSGPTNDLQLRRVRRMVDGLPSLLAERSDFRTAAGIYRAARREGRTIRRVNDCLIAAIALRHDATLVHQDADFEVIADVTGLDHLSLR